MPVPQLQSFEEVRDREGGAVVLQEMVAVSAAAAARNCDRGENVRGTGFAEAWWCRGGSLREKIREGGARSVAGAEALLFVVVVCVAAVKADEMMERLVWLPALQVCGASRWSETAAA